VHQQHQNRLPVQLNIVICKLRNSENSTLLRTVKAVVESART